MPLAGAVGDGAVLCGAATGTGVVTAAAVASVLFVGLVVAFPAAVVDRQKAPRELVRASGAGDPTRDVRLAAFGWFQPSVVYYAGREVAVLESPEAVDGVPGGADAGVSVRAGAGVAGGRSRIASRFRTASRPGTTTSWRSATCW